MNAHVQIRRSVPRLAPSPGSLAAAVNSSYATTAVSRLAAFADLISVAAGDLDQRSTETGSGRCYVSDVYSAEAAMLDAVLCQEPENLHDVLLIAIAGIIRSEALDGHINDAKVSASADAIGLALQNIVNFLAFDDKCALKDRLQSVPGLFRDVLLERSRTGDEHPPRRHCRTGPTHLSSLGEGSGDQTLAQGA